MLIAATTEAFFPRVFFPPVFFPPVQYTPIWPILALGIVVLIVAWFVLVLRFTRERRVQGPVDLDWMPAADTERLRGRYLDLIGDIETAYARGDTDARAAHQRLSMLVRSFAFEASGMRAQQMTLADLRRSHATRLVDAVEGFYPTSFSTVEHGSVAVASDSARRVVISWN